MSVVAKIVTRNIGSFRGEDWHLNVNMSIFERAVKAFIAITRIRKAECGLNGAEAIHRFESELFCATVDEIANQASELVRDYRDVRRVFDSESTKVTLTAYSQIDVVVEMEAVLVRDVRARTVAVQSIQLRQQKNK